jgi:hypothetical protein
MTVTYAPWTEKEVEALYRRQADHRFHPYTCQYHSYLTLHPTRGGWVCHAPGCTYTQAWAHKEDLELR